MISYRTLPKQSGGGIERPNLAFGGVVGRQRWEKTMTKKEFAPVTPGEMLKEEFLAEYGLSQNQLAKAIGISPNRITEIVNNRRRITADTALRLSLYFGNSPEFWLNLQSHYDLKMARSNLKQADIKRIKAQQAA